MRDIKFRAWDKEANYFLNDFVLENGGDVICFDTDGVATIIDAVVMQFTGLTDKNGVDIYESDVVKILLTDWPSQSQPEKLSLEEYKDSLTKVFTITFHKAAFQISAPDYYGDGLAYDDIWCGKHGYIEIIGNIHENPELINLDKDK